MIVRVFELTTACIGRQRKEFQILVVDQTVRRRMTNVVVVFLEDFGKLYG